jgi:hypothetical protein
MIQWLKRKVVVVRAERMTDAELLETLSVDPDAPLLMALKECQQRMEEEVMEAAFMGKPEDRLRDLARVEGSREVLAIMFGFRERAMQLLKQQQAEEARRAK